MTNREYRRLVPDHEGDDELPVVGVSWATAYAYAAWLGGRLPTEAEWEYAARGGSAHEYSARDGSATTLDRIGWYARNSGMRPHPVGQLEPNPWGLYDMYGNVWEWVVDWYGPYDKESQIDPWGPVRGRERVLRGGSYGDDAVRARAAFRDHWAPERRYVAPSTLVEMELAALWAEILGVKRVGLDDDFFDLGGNSLVVIEAISKANKKGLGITAQQFLRHSTLGDLARAAWTSHVLAEEGPVEGIIPFTPAQLHTLDQKHTGSENGFQGFRVVLPGPEILEGLILDRSLRVR